MSRTFAVRDGSIIMESNGQPQIIEGYDKVQQDINDILLTPYDSDRDYGCELFTGGIILAERAAIPGLVVRDVTTAINRLRRMQSQLPREYLPAGEKINKVNGVSVSQPDALSVVFLLSVLVMDRTQEELKKTFKISNKHLENR